MSKLNNSGGFFALTAAVLWGLNYPFIKIGLQYMAIGQYIFLRYLIVVFLFIIYLKLSRDKLHIQRQHVRSLFLLGFIGIGVYNIVWTAGIARIAASDSALLMSTAPIFTGIFAMWAGTEQMNCRKWAGTFLAFGGIYAVISGASEFQFYIESGELIGYVLTLLAALMFAYYTIGAKPLLKYYSPVVVTSLTMAAGLPLLLIASLWEGSLFKFPAMDPESWGIFLYVALMGTNIAFVFWYKGVKHTTPFKTIIFHFLVPIGSMFFGAIFFDEKVNAGRILGAMLVFSGLLLVKYDSFIGTKP